MKHSGGNWNPKEENVYFIASNVNSLQHGVKSHNYILVAVNELNTDEEIKQVEDWADEGKRVFIDSGVFNLANSHAKNNEISMDAALSMAPDDIDGFKDLFEKYCDIISRIGDKVWGYIEVDQGGRENKVKTRARLEEKGFNPIPVYHPFNDGWDYFDYLGQNYDRICFGNIVQADRKTRLRLAATAWERRRKYPNLWIHLLGMTPNEWLNAFPINSCDSSTWLRMVRWSTSWKAPTALKPFTEMGTNWTYDYDADPSSSTGHQKARQLGAYDAHFLVENWRILQKEYTHQIGCDTGLFL
tara:strand:- start:8429 stop:9328 length:900 start_codon:yes stop_codon:yes gene_type:complete